MNNTYQQRGYALIPNVLTAQQCQQFTAIMFQLQQDSKLSAEQTTNPGFYKNSFGIGSYPAFESLLVPVGQRIMDELKINMRPANSYARIYTNGSTLPAHVDRPGLDYTLSISLYTDLTAPWPFYLKDLTGAELACEIPLGHGGFILGREISHWRTPLVCTADQRVVQLFLHWAKI